MISYNDKHRLSTVAGYSSQHLLGTSFYDLVHPLDSKIVQKAFKTCKYHGIMGYGNSIFARRVGAGWHGYVVPHSADFNTICICQSILNKTMCNT
jgi:hypothetical protein